MKDFEDKQDYFSEADLNENDSENEENLKINKEKTQSIKKVVIYKKGRLKFINHMNGKRIFPCDIAELHLTPSL
jgi:type IV secretory pathway VirD2 relaxase